MVRLRYISLAFVCGAALSASSRIQAQSFDCKRALTVLEKAICNNKSVAGLDSELEKVYQQALADYPTRQSDLVSSEAQWLVFRNAECRAHANDVERMGVCLTDVYRLRIDALKAGAYAGPFGTSYADVPPDLLTLTARYAFRLTQGAGEAVCEAYLKRLQATRFRRVPQCEIPENSSVSGFSRLNRVPLTPSELISMFPRIVSFKQTGTQVDKLPPYTSASDVEKQIGDDLFAWRYDPPISVENNGKPDNIEVWQGADLSMARGTCGDTTTVHPNREVLVEGEQIPLVLTADNSRIDEARTKLLFGHPQGNTVVTKTGPMKLTDGLRFIGYSIGFFEFAGNIYFETFYDRWTGDYLGHRVYGDSDHRSLSSTLAVFLRERGQTKQVCEYQMTCHGSSCGLVRDW